MKLKNKLLPLLGVAAACATIAPLATSCKSNDANVTMIDVVDGYTPTIKKADPIANKTEKEVEKIYIDAVKNNPEILLQDLASWENDILVYRMQTMSARFNAEILREENLIPNSVSGSWALYSVPKVAKFGISNPEIKELTLYNPNTEQDVTVHTISMELDYEYDYEVVTACHSQEDPAITANGKEVCSNKFKSKYTNVPFAIKYNSEMQTYSFSTIGYLYNDIWMLNKIPNWQFDLDYTCTYTDSLDYNTGVHWECSDSVNEVNCINSISGLKDAISYLGGSSAVNSSVNSYCFNFGLHYLQDAQAPHFTSTNLGMNNTNYTQITNDPTTATDHQIDINMYGLCYNYSYADVKDAKIINTIQLVDDIQLPIHAIWDHSVCKNNDGTDTCIVIPKETNLDHTRNNFTDSIRLRGSIVWGNSTSYETTKEWTQEQYKNNWFSTYYFTMPKGEYKFKVVYRDEAATEETVTFKLEEDIYFTWDQFTITY